MCALVWRILAWSNAGEIQIRAKHIPGNLNVITDSLSRRDKAIQTEWSLHPLVFQRICHQLESQTSNLCISYPRRQGLADRCVEHLLGDSGRLCLLSSSHPAPVSSEDCHLQVQGHCDSTKVARDALVWGSGGVVNQDSTEEVSGLPQEGQGGFSLEVADRIKAPQRESSR